MSAESHSLAISIELTLRNLFQCERFGLGGYVNSDSIESRPIEAFRIGFATIYPNASIETRTLIDTFIDSNYQYEEQSIDQIGVDVVRNLHEQFVSIIAR
ncbi:hypothetical protein [Alkaliphilus transvaalensis]|uniref:hypothetical protein n=1 Tax=Alkaliphilus transvaalensis TaxID=114628 RepID=UPI00047E0BDE|nr:hypothetical protein [Alkaliphilus transvaalensis]